MAQPRRLDLRINPAGVVDAAIDVEIDMRQQVCLGDQHQIGGGEYVRVFQRLVLTLGDGEDHHLVGLAEIEARKGAAPPFVQSLRKRLAEARSVELFIDPSDELFTTGWDEVMTQGTPYPLTTVLMSRNGRRLDVRGELSRVSEGADGEEFMAFVARDVTDELAVRVGRQRGLTGA